MTLPKMKNKFAKQVILIVAIFLVCFIVFISGVLKPIDRIFIDMAYQTPRAINNDIKIIAIDEKTLDELGPFGSWDRQVYADLVNMISTKDSKPAVIGFDIMLIGNMNEQGDTNFAKSAKEHGDVVCASHVILNESLIIGSEGAYIDNMQIEMLELPYEELNNVSVSGFANATADSDGIVRCTTLSIPNGEEMLYSFATVCYDKYANKKNLETIFPKTDDYYRWWIQFAGYPGDYEIISLSDVINGNINPLLFDETLVLVGAYAPGMQDEFSVPIVKDRQMYGVEIHANAIQAMLDNKGALPANNILSAIVFGIIAALLFLAFRNIKKAAISVILLIVTIIANIFIGVLLYKNGIIINIVYLPIAAIALYIISLVINYVTETKRRKDVTNAFKKYVAPQIVDEMLKSGNFEIKLGGENRHIAAMFVDIRGFTPMSERLMPEEVVEILNLYLNLTTQSIFKYGGTLDKFIGDATMAVFNAPFDLEDYILKAAKTALDILNGAEELKEELMNKYNESVGFGIGLNCGEAVVGNIGCVHRMDYTAIGDTINTAARLESNAASSQILMSEVFYLNIKDKVEAKEIGNIHLKGKTNEMKVYELLRIKDEK